MDRLSPYQILTECLNFRMSHPNKEKASNPIRVAQRSSSWDYGDLCAGICPLRWLQTNVRILTSMEMICGDLQSLEIVKPT